MTDMTTEWFAAHDFWQLGKADDGRAMLLVTEDEYNAIRQALTAPWVPEPVEPQPEEQITNHGAVYSQAEAWQSVVEALDALQPGWILQVGKTATESAVDLIRDWFADASQYHVIMAEGLTAATAPAAQGEPVAWYLPGEGVYDSQFRDHATVISCTGNPWEGWLPLYTTAQSPAKPVVCKHCGNQTMHIGDVCYACCQSPAEQVTDVNGMMVTHDSEGRVSKIVQGGVPALDELAKLRERVRELEGALDGLLAIIGDSYGVTGYYVNGDIAEWDELEEVEQAARLRGGSDEWQKKN